MRLRENSRSASAAATFFPRISWATRLSFCGLTRSMRDTAFASLSPSERSRAFLPMVALSALRATCGGRGWRSGCGSRPARSHRHRCTLGLAIRGMAVEHPRRGELAEFVAHHLLRHQHRDVFLAVIDTECEPNELRQYGRAAAPDPDH